jgi:hypothetical protein
MLAIAIMIVLSAIATMVALVAASPLFRTVSLAFGSWSDTVARAEQN